MRVIFGKVTVDTKLEKPFRLIIGGASGCGKTSILKEIREKNHFASPFEKIVYCYPDYLDEIPTEFDQIVEYRSGICDLEFFTALPKNTLLLFDDMMSECGESKNIMKLFSVIARKKIFRLYFLFRMYMIIVNIFEISELMQQDLFYLNFSQLMM